MVTRMNTLSVNLSLMLFIFLFAIKNLDARGTVFWGNNVSQTFHFLSCLSWFLVLSETWDFKEKQMIVKPKINSIWGCCTGHCHAIVLTVNKNLKKVIGAPIQLKRMNYRNCLSCWIFFYECFLDSSIEKTKVWNVPLHGHWKLFVHLKWSLIQYVPFIGF